MSNEVDAVVNEADELDVVDTEENANQNPESDASEEPKRRGRPRKSEVEAEKENEQQEEKEEAEGKTVVFKSAKKMAIWLVEGGTAVLSPEERMSFDEACIRFGHAQIIEMIEGGLFEIE